MKRKIFLVGICAALVVCFCAAPVFAQIKRGKPDRSAVRAIRQINFLNRTYYAGCADQKVRVRNGKYEPPRNAGSYFQFNVSVVYGDLTGDQREEAVVVTQCDGAVQNFSQGKIYAVRNGSLMQIAQLADGVKNDGDILAAKIAAKRLIVSRIIGREDNCPRETIETEATFEFRNGKLRQIGRLVCKAE